MATRRHTARAAGRRLYAEPALRPTPNMERLMDLVLHLAETEHRESRRTRPETGTGATIAPGENEPQQGLPEGAEPKEH